MKFFIILVLFINIMNTCFGQTPTRTKFFANDIRLRPLFIGIDNSPRNLHGQTTSGLGVYLQTGIHYQLWLAPKNIFSLGIGTGLDMLHILRQPSNDGRMFNIPIYLTGRVLSSSEERNRYGFELQGGLNIPLHHANFAKQYPSWYIYPSFLMQLAFNENKNTLLTLNIGICLQRSIYHDSSLNYNFINNGGLVIELGFEF